MQGLEAELKRLEERNPKDTKPDSTKEITPEEKELREKINAEREAWKKENSRDKRVENLEKELDRLKSRRDKMPNPYDKYITRETHEHIKLCTWLKLQHKKPIIVTGKQIGRAHV